MGNAYVDAHRNSLEDPERFWEEAVEEINWTQNGTTSWIPPTLPSTAGLLVVKPTPVTMLSIDILRTDAQISQPSYTTAPRQAAGLRLIPTEN